MSPQRGTPAGRRPGLVGAASRAGYAASKGAVVQLTRSLDAEIPLGRWAAPGELAGAALLLTDPQSAYLTGAVLPVDGGWTCH